MSVVIYAFRSPGSGAVYLGKHEPKVDPTTWPRRGNGKLPDGYDGSGAVVPRFHARHGAAVQWRILAIVPVADWPRAERRAIHLARLFFGRKCVNRKGGGEGFTSEEARAMHADPAVKARHAAALKDAIARPEVKARRQAGVDGWTASPRGKAHMASRAASPEFKAGRDAWNASPAGQAHMRKMNAWTGTAAGKEALRNLNADPGIKAKTMAALPKAWAATRRKFARIRAGEALAPFILSPTISRPGIRVWVHRPDLPLGIGGTAGPPTRPVKMPRGPARRSEADNSPEAKARRSAIMKEVANRPEVKAKRSATYAARREATAWHSPSDNKE